MVAIVFIQLQVFVRSYAYQENLMSFDLSALTAAQLDELLVTAAKRRAELAPAPDMQPPAQCEAIVNPAWHTAPMSNGVLFMLRHPGLGWLGFALPHEHRVHLATLWLHQSMLQKPEVTAATLAEAPVPPPTPAVGAGGSGSVH
jgi:hypothetical protein